MRVAFVLRSAEVQPLFRDLCDTAPCSFLSKKETRQRVATSFQTPTQPLFTPSIITGIVHVHCTLYNTTAVISHYILLSILFYVLNEYVL